MKSFRALLLVLALSVCAFAGEMDHGKTLPPLPPLPPSSRAAASEKLSVSSDGWKETAISLLQTLLVLV
jgi:hypothetical protein